MKISGTNEVKCECCDAFTTLPNALKLDWDWFTQHLPRAYHYCAKHRNSAHRHQMWNLGQIKPPERKKSP